MLSSFLSSFTFADALTLTTLLSPVLYYVAKWLVETLPSNQQEVVKGIVASAVTAVEQMMQTPGSGQLKKQEASQLISDALARRRITIPPAEISTEIECAVKAMRDAAAASAPPVSAPPVSAPIGFTPAPAQLETPQPAPAGIVGFTR